MIRVPHGKRWLGCLLLGADLQESEKAESDNSAAPLTCRVGGEGNYWKLWERQLMAIGHVWTDVYG